MGIGIGYRPLAGIENPFRTRQPIRLIPEAEADTDCFQRLDIYLIFTKEFDKLNE